MLGRFGASLFGLSEFIRKKLSGAAKIVAVVGDTSTHGGSIITSGQDGTLTVTGLPVAVDGCQFNCPSHGTQTVTAIITRTTQNGKLLITKDAIVGCGAKIIPTDRGVFAR